MELRVLRYFLEEELGKKLFIRSNYSIKLTEEGLLLKKKSRRYYRHG